MDSKLNEAQDEHFLWLQKAYAEHLGKECNGGEPECEICDQAIKANVIPGAEEVYEPEPVE